MKRGIVWFKTDLRIEDNETLIKAIEENDEVIPVYCLDDTHVGFTQYGFAKMGNFRARFLLESLADLNKRLRKLGSGLYLLKGKPEVEITQLAFSYGVKRVYAKKEVATEEKQRQERVEKSLWKIGCVLDVFSTSTLYHAQDLPFSIKDIPNVFTDFRKKVERETTVRAIFNAPDSISSPTIPNAVLPTLRELGLTAPKLDSRAVLVFKGGETEALHRMQYYFFDSKALSTYKQTRNGMVGNLYSSKFSAWLALGCISPRKVYHEVKKYEKDVQANESTYWLIFELLWRDYFRFMMKKYPLAFFQKKGISSKEMSSYTHQPSLLKKWIDGKTGVDFIDANMKELKFTGFMSNRGRQNTASFLCHDLKLDWRYGAAYFEQQLIDYDVCSNWGNWAYIAGVGNDLRTDRYFNIEKQASQYDPQKLFQKLWLKT